MSAAHWHVVWCPDGALPLPAELVTYLVGPLDARVWRIVGGEDPAWSPYWTRVLAHGVHDARRLALHAARVTPAGTLEPFSPWDRGARGGEMERRMRDLAAGHRVRFRRVLSRGLSTMVLVEGHGEAHAAERLALAAACELARRTAGVVVDSARNIGTAEEMAARHRLQETVVQWLPVQGRRPGAVDKDGVLSVRCRVWRAPFAMPPTAPADLGGLSPRWDLSAVNQPVPDEAWPGGDVLDHGRMAPLTAQGVYQASLDVRRACRPGGRYALVLGPGTGLTGVRNASLEFSVPQG